MDIESYLKTINKDNFKNPMIRKKYIKSVQTIFLNHNLLFLMKWEII